MAQLAPPDPGDRGDGRYASYHALWHLFEIGVVERLSDFASPAWDAAEAALAKDGRPTRVALIDTSVAMDHPNLKAAILHDLAIDFLSNRLGTFPAPAGDRLRELVNAAAAPATGGETVSKLFAELCKHLPEEHRRAREGEPQSGRVFPATSPAFSCHGTAMAGLIGARPLGPDEVRLAAPPVAALPNGEALDHGQVPSAVGFAYAGVDPYCEIVPISTGFDPDPEQFILALLYAVIVQADLIVLARDFPDPMRSAISGRRGDAAPFVLAVEASALEGVRPSAIEESERALWDALAELVVKVSLTCPILCAAGNGGDDAMLYPGWLSAPDNGIIVVGAHTAAGQKAGYSTRSTDTAAVAVYAPSGDAERLDTEFQRLDRQRPGFRAGDHSPGYLAQGEGGNAFSAIDIVTTDVPGAAGYNSSAFPDISPSEGGVPDYRSYYCRFSGTSAATAIAAGLLSLAMTAGHVPRGDGPAARAKLPTNGKAHDDDAAQPRLKWQGQAEGGGSSSVR